MPTWISERVVLAIHRRHMAEHGGLEGIRDSGALTSALAKPKNLYAYHPHSSLYSLAAAYGLGLARNHPFLDGNKRTSYVIMRLFLRLNGQDIYASDYEKYTVMMRVASGDLVLESLTAWLKSHGD